MTDLDHLSQLLEEAQELEEKGDRYVDGEKAKRFYIRSCEIYSRINSLEEDMPQVLYNWARILFILSEFKNPETSTEQSCLWLSQALDKFLRLASIEKDNIDLLFNVAQTLHALVIKSQSDQKRLHEALWYLDKIKGKESLDPNSNSTEMERLTLRIEILNSMMEYSNDIHSIQKTFSTILNLFHESLESNVILRIAESYHIFAFKVYELKGLIDSDLFSSALGLIDLVLRTNSNHVEALCDRADICISWADLAFQHNISLATDLYTQALDSLSKASKIEPANLDIMVKLGDTHLSRLRLYSSQDTKIVCAKNAHVYYQCALKKKPQMWTLYHYLKAISWISNDPKLESDKAWNMLSKLASDNHISLNEWMSSEELLEVPFGSYWNH